MGADFSPIMKEYSGVRTFRFWCQKVLPLVYDDSLSYYELLCKVVSYINNLIEDGQKMGENIDALLAAYNLLQEYVNNYFANLDVQNEINNKLNEMAENGDLTNLLLPYIPNIITAWLDENVNPVGSAVIVNPTLNISGAAADAKVVGDKMFWSNRRAIVENDDFNNIIQPGSYSKPYGITVENCPTTESGYLLVYTSSTANPIQEFYARHNKKWVRGKFSDTWEDWTEYKISNDNYANEENTYMNNRGALTEGFDISTIEKPGFYTKPSSINIVNGPDVTGTALIGAIGTQNNYVNYYHTSNDFYFKTYLGVWNRLIKNSDNPIIPKGTLTATDSIANVTPGIYNKPNNVVLSDLPINQSGIVIKFNNNLAIMHTNKNCFYSWYNGTINLVCYGTDFGDNRLYGKYIIGMGDSLMYGQGLSSRSLTWFNQVGQRFNMNYTNAGVSGNKIYGDMTGRIDTLLAQHDNCDYFILEGGANDMWNNVTINNFKDAIEEIVVKVRNKYTGVRILIMTNYNRKPGRINSLGLTDETYVNAMIDKAKELGCPYFDNYHDSGIPNTEGREWAYLSDDHLSEQGMNYLIPIYIKKLLEI